MSCGHRRTTRDPRSPLAPTRPRSRAGSLSRYRVRSDCRTRSIGPTQAPTVQAEIWSAQPDGRRNGQDPDVFVIMIIGDMVTRTAQARMRPPTRAIRRTTCNSQSRPHLSLGVLARFSQLTQEHPQRGTVVRYVSRLNDAAFATATATWSPLQSAARDFRSPRRDLSQVDTTPPR